MDDKQAGMKDIATKVIGKAKDVGRGVSQGARGIGGGGSASVAEAVGASAGKGARSVAQAAKKHPYAAAGIGGAGALAGGAALAAGKKKEKTASDIADAILTKVGFSVTEEGHEWDANRAAAKQKYFQELASQLADKDALAYKTDEGDTHRGKILSGLRFGEGDPRAALRSLAYTEKKHREGKNAWNPFGGMLTPHSSEGPGASKWMYGRPGGAKQEEAPPAPPAQKAASVIADEVLAKLS
jgi:hypothetical protein